MFIVAGIIILLIYGALVYYIGRTLARWILPGADRLVRILYSVVLAIVSTSFISGRFLGNPTVLSIIGSYWMAAFYVLILVIPVLQLALWLLRLEATRRSAAEKRAGWTVLLLMLAVIGYGSFNAYSPVVETYDIQIAKEAEGKQGLRVVMASDMHFGVLSGKSHAERMVKEINALDPDIVFFPGDIIDDDLDAYLRQDIDRILTGIKSDYGVYASLGNHDRFDGEIPELIEALENSGMTVLYDETLEVEGLTLAGRRDKSDSERAALSEVLEGADKEKPLILLDHQPNALDEAMEEGVDLILSGHTHRGQVFPGHLITGAIFENDWGYLRKENLQSIVSSGYGFWGPPIRIGSRAELVLINLTFGQ